MGILLIQPADKELIGRKVIMCGAGIATERGAVMPDSIGCISNVVRKINGTPTCWIEWELPAMWPMSETHWGMPEVKDANTFWFELMPMGFCAACETVIDNYPAQPDFLCESCRANG